MTLWWTLLKLLRYLLPFLHEVTREDTLKDEEDFMRAFYIKKTVYRILWRLVVIVILGVIIFYKIIPMHSENIVMQHEIVELKMQLEKSQRTMLNAQDNAADLRTRNTSLDMEVKRLNAILLDCRADLSHERALRNQSLAFQATKPKTVEQSTVKEPVTEVERKIREKLKQIN